MTYNEKREAYVIKLLIPQHNVLLVNRRKSLIFAFYSTKLLVNLFFREEKR